MTLQQKERTTEVPPGSGIIPLPFCGQMWIKDKKGANIALKILSNILKYVNEMLKEPRSQISVSISFTTVRPAVQGGLKIGKSQFFVSVMFIMKPYLQMFQEDVPLLPFTTTEIKRFFQCFNETVCKKVINRSCRYSLHHC